MAEVAWPPEPVSATLRWLEPADGVDGWLHFQDPSSSDGAKAAIPITRGESHNRNSRNVWHIEATSKPQAGELVLVSPSIHFIDHFHSPNPAQFRLVDELP